MPVNQTRLETYSDAIKWIKDLKGKMWVFVYIMFKAMMYDNRLIMVWVAFPVLGLEVGVCASHCNADVCLQDVIISRCEVLVTPCESESMKSFFPFTLLNEMSCSSIFYFASPSLLHRSCRLQCLSTVTWCWWQEKMSQADVMSSRVLCTSDSWGSRTVREAPTHLSPNYVKSWICETIYKYQTSKNSIGFIICFVTFQCTHKGLF